MTTRNEIWLLTEGPHREDTVIALNCVAASTTHTISIFFGNQVWKSGGGLKKQKKTSYVQKLRMKQQISPPAQPLQPLQPLVSYRRDKKSKQLGLTH